MTNSLKPRNLANETVIHPGVEMANLMENHGFSQADLAKRTGISTKTINLIIKEHSLVSPEIAIALESVLGKPAEDWMALVAAYQVEKANLTQQSLLDKDLELLKLFDLKKMLSAKWIKKSNERGLAADTFHLKQLLSFFGVASLQQLAEVWSTREVNYRTSDLYEKNNLNIMAWLRKGELEGHAIDCEPFNAKNFKKALSDLRSLTNEPFPDVRDEIQTLCAKAGVAVIFTPELRNISTSGAAQWLSKDKALIQLSLRGKSNDKFWFDFYHEAGHILLHGKKKQFIDSEEVKTKNQEEIEDEADEFSSNMLIPHKDLIIFISKADFSNSAIVDFANSVDISPGIVVGRLQKLSILPWSKFNTLKVKYNF